MKIKEKAVAKTVKPEVNETVNWKRPTVRKKKLAICGTAPTIDQTPFDDPEFEIWGVAHCAFLPTVKRMDRIFEIHAKEIWLKDNAPFHRFPNCILYFQEKDEKFDNSDRFPLEIMDNYVVNKGYPGEARYASSSIPYMIAMALEEGYEEVHFYGIHLLQNEEYFFQRPCMERYVGIMEGRGIKVYIPVGADVCKFSYMYGYEDGELEAKKSQERAKEFEGRINNLQQQRINMLTKLDSEINQLLGARENEMYHLRTFGKEAKK
jgi:hypothetical protein